MRCRRLKGVSLNGLFGALESNRSSVAAAAGSSSCTAVNAVGTRSSVRTHFHFSAESPTLARTQLQAGYQSSVWLEPYDAEFLKLPSPKGLPVVAQLRAAAAFFNVEQLVEILKLPNVHEESSYSTKLPYAQQMASALRERREILGYQSRWWIHPSSMKRLGYHLRDPSAKPVEIPIVNRTHVFNTDQFAVAGLSRIPINGATRLVFPKRIQDSLLPVVERHNYSTGLFFNPQVLRRLKYLTRTGEFLHQVGSRSDEDSGSSGTVVGGSKDFYRVDELHQWELALNQFGRIPLVGEGAGAPHHLVTGLPVTIEKEKLRIQSAQSTRKHLSQKKEGLDHFATNYNYWITLSDIRRYGLKLKAEVGARPTPTLNQQNDSTNDLGGDVDVDGNAESDSDGKGGNRFMSRSLCFFNADQLATPLQTVFSEFPSKTGGALPPVTQAATNAGTKNKDSKKEKPREPLSLAALQSLSGASHSTKGTTQQGKKYAPSSTEEKAPSATRHTSNSPMPGKSPASQKPDRKSKKTIESIEL